MGEAACGEGICEVPGGRFGGKLGVDATEKTETDGIGQPWPEEIVMTEDIRALVTRRWAEYGL
jgi:4-hydroxy-3-polyprenylbenzoate decarboxylase